jgi:hypothetical protein
MAQLPLKNQPVCIYFKMRAEVKTIVNLLTGPVVPRKKARYTRFFGYIPPVVDAEQQTAI